MCGAHLLTITLASFAVCVAPIYSPLRALRERRVCGAHLLTITLASLRSQVLNDSARINASLLAAGYLDTVLARQRYGVSRNCIVPEVSDQAEFRIVKGRHPLIPNAVPNEVALDDVARCLILSGPNSGGKTVILKMIGLHALMVNAGIPIQASAGTRVAVFPQVISDIGDNQVLDSKLSTYTSHLVTCKTILEKAPSLPSLVLLDEIGSGTDPEQGSALAIAVLEELCGNAGVRACVTTHYNAIKNLPEKVSPLWTRERGKKDGSDDHARPTIIRQAGSTTSAMRKSQMFRRAPIVKHAPPP